MAGGDWGRLGAPQQHRQPPVQPSTPYSIDLKTSANLGVTSTLLRSVYCEDTRPQNQLNVAKEQHKDLYNILRGASVTLHIILLGVGGTIYNTHTLKPFKELGLDSQRVKKLASKLHVHSVNFTAKLVHTKRALSSTIINSHQEPVSGQACNPRQESWSPLIFPSFPRWRSFTVLSTKVAPFPKLNMGSGFHCLRSFFFFSFSFRVEPYRSNIPN